MTSHAESSVETSTSSGSDTDGNGSNDEGEERFIRRKTKFTPEIDQQLIQLRQEGLSWASIGSRLGIPIRVCHRRYSVLLDPKLKSDWSEEKVQRLDEMVAEGKSWGEISKELNITSLSCQAKWKSLVKPKESERNRVFDALQSKVLLELVKEHGEDNWKAVMRGFMLRLGSMDMAKVTPAQLRHQYYCLKRKTLSYWSMSEETALIQHVLKNGTNQWEMISEALKYHSPEQCKEKWTTLDMSNKTPKVKRWYKAEQGNFWRLWQRYGDDWEKIAPSLKRRTPEQCRDFFNKATAHLNKDDPEQFKKEVENIALGLSDYKTISWTKENSDRLWEIAEKYRLESKANRIDWNIVAEKMDLGLMPDQYKYHHYYLRAVSKGGLAGTWTDEEIKKLELVVQKEGRNWVEISKKYFPHRNAKALCHKFRNIVNKGLYISEEEYDSLLAQVDLQETAYYQNQSHTLESLSDSPDTFKPDWEKIAKAMPSGTWTAEQCQKAYDGSFKNHLKHSNWTPEDDGLLKKATRFMGQKNWVNIAMAVPGKNSWECRLRYAELHEPLVEGSEALPGLLAKTKEKKDYHVTVD
ncbi:hypothetical protein FBU30_007575 [Linnemannia zychae]|nr:hypothetical protein FBU30_007575 [Linnemannia zychae]